MKFLAGLVMAAFFLSLSTPKSEAAATGRTRKPKKSSAKKTTVSSKKRLTPADAEGLRDAKPGSLKAMAVGVLEKNSTADEKALAAYAQRHKADVDGVLARLVLGYHAYLGGHFADAKENFEAARGFHSSLQDYSEYYLAMSDLGAGDRASAEPLLAGFGERYPLSPMAAQATLKMAELLIASDRAAEAVALLQSPPVSLPPAPTDLQIGLAYEKDHHNVKAAEYLQRVYYLYATSPQALQAERELKGLRAELGDSYPVPSEEMRITRADRLFAGSQWRDAEAEYKIVVGASSGSNRDRARVRIGVCQARLGESQAALRTLKDTEVGDPEADAERMYHLGALYWHLGRPSEMEEQVQRLGQAHPSSPWYQKALFLAGNYYLVSADQARAAEYYTTLYQTFPTGDLAPESHWRAAWRKYRERNLPEARRLFEEHLRNYPGSPQSSAAIYWIGRTYEAEAPVQAARYYRKLVDTFPNYYYGLIARQRLASLPKAVSNAAGDPLPDPLLDPIHRPVPDSALQDDSPSSANQLRKERAKLLESAWLLDLAIDELKAGVVKDSFNFSLGRQIAHLEQERGRYNVALQYGKRLLTGYFALDVSELPEDDWRMLFPLPWWNSIKKQAETTGLDPYLVAGLIRQESEFNPDAVSPSNARGLMQLLPSTARRMAKQMQGSRSRYFRLASLSQPEYNVTYGTYYLRQLLNQFNGSLEQSLAAYNAGENRVVEWLQAGNFDEPAEFVENIPFTETREYVQAIMRNVAVYKKLYSDSDSD